MRSSKVFRRFIWVYLLLHTLAALVFLIVATKWIGDQLTSQSFARLESIAQLICHHLRSSVPDLENEKVSLQMQELAATMNFRISVIGIDGEVLFDSESYGRRLENHADRPEFVLARKGATGTAIRYSESVGRNLYYVAVPFSAIRSSEATADPAGLDSPRAIVRVAGELNEMLRIQRTLLQFLWLFGGSLAVLSSLLMWRYMRREIAPLAVFHQVARSIASGKQEPIPLLLSRNDEWRSLASAFRKMQAELQTRESRLVENSQRLEAVLGSMVEGVIALDGQGFVRLANDAAHNMLDPSRVHFQVGRRLRDVVKIASFVEAIEKVQSTAAFQEVEFETLDTPRRVIRARVSRLDQQRLPAIAIVLHDLTELRRMENMRRDFVANVSHELKTPLASILAYTETLYLGALHDPQRNMGFLCQIEAQTLRLQQQIEDLLTLAKVESGGLVLETTCFSLEDLCQEAVESFQTAARAKSIQLHFEPGASPTELQSDYDELLIVINNLLSNAIRYTPEGGSVIVRTFREGDQGGFEVTDTGIGIAAEHQNRIFERFYRVDKARSRELGGTGLGLSIVKHLTQALGGTVRLISEVGKGSTFRVQLPCCQLEPQNH